MGCKATKVLTAEGVPSELYEALSIELGPGAALEAYLDMTSKKDHYSELYGLNEQGEINQNNLIGSPKFKLKVPGVKDNTQMREVTDYVTDFIIEGLQTQADARDITTLAEINYNKISKDPLALTKALTHAKKHIEGVIELLDGPQAAMMKAVNENLIAMVGNDVSLGPVGQKLREYGIDVNVRAPQEQEIQAIEAYKEEINEEYNQEVVAATANGERIYSMDMLEMPTSSTVLHDLRIYLKRVPKVDKTAIKSAHPKQLIEAGEVIPTERTSIGYTAKEQPSIVLGKLLTVLKGSQSLDEVFSKVENSIDKHKELIPIYTDLLAERQNPITLKKIGKYYKLHTALYSAVKADYDMISVATLDGGTTITTKANSRDAASSLKTEWNSSVKEAGVNPNREAHIAEIEGFLSLPNIKFTLNPTPSENNIEGLPTNARLALISKYFQLGGFTSVSPETLKQLIRDIKQNPKSFGNTKNPTNSSIIRTLLKNLPIKALEGKNVFKTDKSFGENRYMNLLANSVAPFSMDGNSSTFRSADGTVKFQMNQSSEAQDVLERFSDPEVVSTFLNDPIYSNSLLVQELADDTTRPLIKTHTFDTLTDNSSGDKGVGYGGMSTYHALGLRAQMFFRPLGQSSDRFQAIGPTQSDRGKAFVMDVPFINMNSLGEFDAVQENDKITSEPIQDWVKTQLASEVVRAINMIGAVGEYVNYSNNAFQFNLFTTVNESVNLKEIVESGSTLEDVSSIVERAYPAAEKEFLSTLSYDTSYYKDNSLITLKDDSVMFTPGSQEFTSIPGKRTKNGVEVPKNSFDSYLANNFIYTYEMALLQSGDLAFYKGGSKTKQMQNLNKRLSLPFVPGNKVATGEGSGIAATSKVLILNEAITASEFSDVYSAVVGKPSFTNIELADGSGIVALDFYKSLLVSQGLHTQETLEYIDQLILNKEKTTPNPNNIRLPELKSAYYRLLPTEINGNTVMIPFALKYSLTPAVPSLYEAKGKDGAKYPGLDKISKVLRSGKAQQVVMPTAVKVGARHISNIQNLDTATPVVINNDGIRFPQVSPKETKTQDGLGSQMRKLIELNSMYNKGVLNVPGTSSTVDAHSKYQDALSTLTKKGAEKAESSFTLEGVPNDHKLKKAFLDKVASSEFKDENYFADALFPEEGDPLSFMFPTLRGQLDSTINSSFRSKAGRPKLPGHSAVQISNMGMYKTEDGGMSLAGDLKFVNLTNKDGETLTPKQAKEWMAKVEEARVTGEPLDTSEVQVQPAEIRVSPHYFFGKTREEAAKAAPIKYAKPIKKELLEYKDLLVESGASSAQIASALSNKRKVLISTFTEKMYNTLIQDITNNKGELDISKVRAKGLDKTVLYRIPTQRKSSMLPAVIKDFLPSGYGNTVQVPAEIVEQAGSDFDIDKVYVEMQDFASQGSSLESVTYDTEAFTEQGAKAYIKEFHYSVLTSPAYIGDILQPNSTATLKQIAEDFGASSEMPSNVAGIATQEQFRSDNKAGKELIAIASVASVAHSVAKKIGAAFKSQVLVKGVSSEALPAELGMEKTLDGSTFISDEIAEIQDAALDNANDPLLGHLNIDMFTAPAALFLVSTGQGLNFAVNVLNAPIVKEIARVFPKYELRYSRATALKLATKEAKKSFGVKGRQGKVAGAIDSFSSQDAERLLNPQTSEDHATSLQAFLGFLEVGDALSSFQRATNFDSKGTSSSVPGLISQYRALHQIEGTHTSKDPATRYNILGDQKPPSIEFKLGPDYMNSHISNMELSLISAPLELHSKLGISLTKNSATILTTAEKYLNIRDENSQVKLFAAYDTYKGSKNSSVYSNPKIDSLTNDANLANTASKIKAFRRQAKNTGKTNAFIDSLTIIKKEGRSFVVFDNLTANAMAKEDKKYLKQSFEDLASSTLSSERDLARSLGEYGVTMYGYEKSPNSFVEHIPVSVLRSLDGVVESFSSEAEMSNNDADKFLDLYVSNNFRSLGLQSYMKMLDGEYVDYMQEIAEVNNGRMPRYVTFYSKGVETPNKFVNGTYVPMEILGIPGVAVEYSGQPSVYNQINGEAVKSNVSEKGSDTINNKVIAENIQVNNFESYIDMFDAFSIFEGDLTTREGRDQASDKLLNKMVSLGASYTDAKAVVDRINANTNRYYSSRRKSTPTSMEVRNAISSIAEEFLDITDMHKETLNKIQKC